MERRNNRLNRYAIGPILKVYHFFSHERKWKPYNIKPYIVESIF